MSPPVLAFDDRGSGPAVVLVHGHPFDRSMWEPQLEPLARRFRVIAPDLRGYGESPATAGTVTMRELADDVEALLDRLEIASAAVVGLSMGGLIAMELTIARPEHCWALGLVATTAEPVTEDERRERLAAAETLETQGMDPLAAAAAGDRPPSEPRERRPVQPGAARLPRGRLGGTTMNGWR